MAQQYTANTTNSGTNFGQQIGQINVVGETASPEQKRRFLTLAEPEDKRHRIANWLAPLSFLQKQIDVFGSRAPGTGQGFLQSRNFKDWFAGNTNVLWCQGIRKMKVFHSTLSVAEDSSNSWLWQDGC